MGTEPHPMVPVPEAIRTVLRQTAEILLDDKKDTPTLRLPLSSTPWQDLLGRVLAEDVTMVEPGYPPYNASIMDGYAIGTGGFSAGDAERASAAGSWTHRVVDRVYAGGASTPQASNDGKDETLDETLPPACYITTGAVVPEGYDCVVPIEECEASPPAQGSPQRIRILPSAVLKKHKWIRPIGCDIAASEVVLPGGHVLDPVAIGLAMQSGARDVVVQRRIKVGVLSTGNELIGNDGGRTPAPQNAAGKIPDANRPVLLGLLSTHGFQTLCEPIDLGMVRDDDFDAMAETLGAALDRCDVVVTTGGVSEGETDIVERVLVEHCGATLHFGRMHMKPGKPTTFFTVPNRTKGGTGLVFAQPGNPCSAVVCTQLLVGPCLDLYFHGIDRQRGRSSPSGETRDEQLESIVEASLVHPEIEAVLAHDVVLDAKRPEYHRVVLTKNGYGESYEARSTGVQRSSRLMSLRDAQGLLLLPHAKGGKTVARRGETYPVLLLHNTFGRDRVLLGDSVHLGGGAAKRIEGERKNGNETTVGVIEVLPPERQAAVPSRLEEFCERVQSALSPPGGSGGVSVVSRRTFSGPADALGSFVATDSHGDAGVLVVVCPRFGGSFRFHLDVASALGGVLSGSAEALALQARLGAASRDPGAALFEAVAGVLPGRRGGSGPRLLMCVEEGGMEGALGSIRGLLAHGARVARGSHPTPIEKDKDNKKHDTNLSLAGCIPVVRSCEAKLAVNFCKSNRPTSCFVLAHKPNYKSLFNPSIAVVEDVSSYGYFRVSALHRFAFQKVLDAVEYLVEQNRGPHDSHHDRLQHAERGSLGLLHRSVLVQVTLDVADALPLFVRQSLDGFRCLGLEFPERPLGLGVHGPHQVRAVVFLDFQLSLLLGPHYFQDGHLEFAEGSGDVDRANKPLASPRFLHPHALGLEDLPDGFACPQFSLPQGSPLRFLDVFRSQHHVLCSLLLGSLDALDKVHHPAFYGPEGSQFFDLAWDLRSVHGTHEDAAQPNNFSGPPCFLVDDLLEPLHALLLPQSQGADGFFARVHGPHVRGLVPHHPGQAFLDLSVGVAIFEHPDSPLVILEAKLGEPQQPAASLLAQEIPVLGFRCFLSIEVAVHAHGAGHDGPAFPCGSVVPRGYCADGRELERGGVTSKHRGNNRKTEERFGNGSSHRL
ncbi:unnamed protein product [Pseudo-nitzschia multistriata]|uniref:molybdopterin adenylyltransferase n=1 Tax=Pseudo-nitzschia multistriata TaxID=183589 RepID=A0A448Z7D0_9STRA|nr:unnamed protein product [Pseudo-nitzschia multistriata]